MNFTKLHEKLHVNPEAEAELEKLTSKWKADGVDTWIFLDDNDITLSKIKIPPEMRGLGLGTQVMKELIDFADKRNLRILLTPSTAFGATSVGRLEKFYSRFGFKKNAGRNKDFTTRETMIRDHS